MWNWSQLQTIKHSVTSQMREIIQCFINESARSCSNNLILTCSIFLSLAWTCQHQSAVYEVSLPKTILFSTDAFQYFAIWRWTRALNFFGRAWRGLFWVEPVLLNRCMLLNTVLLQLSSGSWQSSYSLRHLYVEQQLFFSDPQRVLCHEVPCWTSSDQYERVRAITLH